MKKRVFTIGHSTHPFEAFLNLLERHGVDTVCDVRSMPYSRFNPQFSREPLRDGLKSAGKTYVFLGEELGARSADPACYRDRRVQYGALAKTPLFRRGIDRLKTGLGKGHVMALMCAEKDPLDCHRTILVAQELEREGIGVAHILADGSLESHAEATERLVRKLRLRQSDLFAPGRDATLEAFREQGKRIAYVDAAMDTGQTAEAIAGE